MDTTTLSVTLWAANLEPPAASLAAWLKVMEARLAEARAVGSRILVLPELSCVQWLGFAPPGLAADRQLPWLAEQARQALPGLRAIAARHDTALLAGTFPWALEDGGIVNRAWLMLPDGQALAQDKLFLTPSEQNPQGWRFNPGGTVNIIHWQGLRIAVLVCLDSEATALWARLGDLDLDLILIPAKTDGLSGYYRVFGCARARALELQTAVCVVGAVGTVQRQPSGDTIVGGAAAYLPSDVALDLTGVAAVLEPQPPEVATSPVLHATHLPIGYCRQIRHGAAEAETCPASWPVAHIDICDPAVSS